MTQGKTYRIDSDTVVNGTVTAGRFIGIVEGVMEEAVVAQKDYLSQDIDSTYVKSISTSDGVTINVTKGNDTAAPPVVLKTFAAGTGLTSAQAENVVTISAVFGSEQGTACEGNDLRLSDDRYPLPHDQSSATITSLSDYVIAQSVEPISQEDSLNTALGKLEKGYTSKQDILSVTSPIVLESNNVSHAASGVTATSGSGFYNRFTVDDKGHITSGSRETTIEGIGITEDVFTAAGFVATLVNTDNV